MRPPYMALAADELRRLATGSISRLAPTPTGASVRLARRHRPSRASLTSTAHPAPECRGARDPFGAGGTLAGLWGRGTASFISVSTLSVGTHRILTADHMDTCSGHGRSAVIEREYTCALRTTIIVGAHSFVRVSPRIAHT
ncbi:unnamed protein product [Arctia plantaginis]|uniref:Uncharacterized protein n=1 Tax=Arctia plantaginis TaxID=874455 RepID=A0A8S0ZVG5_ARCPL|nr:unnamed protein product [Arctia plantaginis]